MIAGARKQEPDRNKIPDHQKRPGLSYPSLRIVLIYFVIGCAWILFSDKLAGMLFRDTAGLVAANIVKGLGYVTVTALLLFVLISGEIKKIRKIGTEQARTGTLLSAILESSPELIVFALDRDYRYTAFNNRHRETARNEWGRDIAVGINVFEVISSDNRQDFKADLDRALTGESFSKEVWVDRTGLDPKCWKVFYAPILDKDDSIVGLTCFLLNITERKQTEEEIQLLLTDNQHKRMLLTTLINSIPDLIFYKDIDGVYRGCNSAFEAFAGKKEKEIVGLTDLDLFDKNSADMFRAMDREMIKQCKPRINEELVTYPDGTKVYLETLKTPYYDAEKRVLGLIGVSRDITERKDKEKEILELTYRDTLTGLYNRTYFEEARRSLDNPRQLPLTVITGDINGLKLINDAFGHSAGDRLLIDISRILKSSTRQRDIAARIGGDEFCILLPRTDSEEAQTVVDRIKEACGKYMNKDTYYASISLGHATKKDMKEPFEKVFRTAEEYMYRRKMLEYKSQHSSIIASIRSTMFEKSNETEAHAERLAQLSRKLGAALGLPDRELVELELLSTLHDIGKISVDAGILTKCGALTDAEWLEIKKHPEVGYRITQAIPELKQISEYILSHHERWDGRGYPQGLSREAIPLLSRIITVVDSYDAMTQDRVYRKAMSIEDAAAEIKNNAGTQFDPVVARVFLEQVLERSE